MRIALDALGTDGAPAPEVSGAVQAVNQLGEGLEVVLVGDRELVEAELERHARNIPEGRLHVHHAPDRVLPGEPPASVIRRRPESSIVRGLQLHKDGEVDAFVSAGSTGAVMAASLFILRPLPGVDRPAIGTLLPTAHDPVLMLDAGANVDTRSRQLVQFAHLGNIYAQDLMGVESPRIALLNIGEEPEKGDELAVEAHGMLQAEAGLNFIGNVEGREIIRGACDVLVCDGFVGNVLLKFYESVAEFIIGLLKSALRETETTIDLEEVFRVLDYSEYGGAPLLGVNGVTIICHGGSPPKAIHNALGVAAQAVRSNMVSHIARELAVPSDSASA
ncbi:MAG: phosphate acyltransferase PlsX [Gemmatimonadota bacterium]